MVIRSLSCASHLPSEVGRQKVSNRNDVFQTRCPRGSCVDLSQENYMEIYISSMTVGREAVIMISTPHWAG